MNTDRFKSEVNTLACRTEQDMRAICGMGRSGSGDQLPPLTQEEFNLMQTLLALQGRDGFTAEQKKQLADLIKRHMANGGQDPYNVPDPEAPPTAGSFATHSIDNIMDLLNFFKGSCILSLGASINPYLIVPTSIVISASFIYATRKLIFKYI